MSFESSPISGDNSGWVTTIEFIHVLDFRFYDFELGLEPPNSEDFEFGLIELRSSTLLERFVSTGAVRRTAMPVTNESDLHHYRIAFDDHGIYDVVCVDIRVSREKVSKKESSTEADY